MGMISEFKEFALKGSMIDMAVGLILGGAVGTVVKSLVDDVISPVVGLVAGKDFSAIGLSLTEKAGEAVKADGVVKAREAGEAVMGLGLFINAFIAFMITAFVLFMIIKAINKARGGAPAPDPTPDQALLTEIRDLLKSR